MRTMFLVLLALLMGMPSVSSAEERFPTAEAAIRTIAAEQLECVVHRGTLERDLGVRC